MYHFRSFPAIPLSPVSTFRFSSVVARSAVPIVWRAACPAAICLRPVPRSVASSHVINRSPCLLSHDATSHSRIADVGISPLPVSVGRGVERGASAAGSCGSCLVLPSIIELTETAHPVTCLCRNCVVPASPYSAHIIYTRTRYYVFVKRRSRRQCPLDGDIGSEVFRNERISS